LLVAVCAILCKVDADPSFNCLNYWVLLNILSIIEKYHKLLKYVETSNATFHIVHLVLYFLVKTKQVVFIKGEKTSDFV